MNTTTATTKVTKLTAANVSALDGHADRLKATVGKTTATFEGTPAAALSRVRQLQHEVAAKQGGRHHTVASLHAVARKLEAAAKDQPTVPTDEQRKAALEEAKGYAAVQVGGVTVAETQHVEATPKLELVMDSTTLKGVFGPSIPEAVAEEKAKRIAAQEAPVFQLDNANLKSVVQLPVGPSVTEAPAEDEQKPGWATAKVHGIKPGDTYLFFGRSRKSQGPGELRTFEHNQVGGAATRFWAIKVGDAVPAEKAEEAAPAKKDSPAKKTGGSRAIPDEAVNSARQAWVKANGMETYRKQYNGGWDNATAGTGEKRAKSGEASVAWMDGYTDRKANPGKAGIAAKWSALKSDAAPVAKIDA